MRKKSAKTVVRSFEETVRDFESAWKAAKAARRALEECASDEDARVGATTDEGASWQSSASEGTSWQSGGSEGSSGQSGANEGTQRPNGAKAVSPSLAGLLAGCLPILVLLRES